MVHGASPDFQHENSHPPKGFEFLESPTLVCLVILRPKLLDVVVSVETNDLLGLSQDPDPLKTEMRNYTEVWLHTVSLGGCFCLGICSCSTTRQPSAAKADSQERKKSTCLSKHGAVKYSRALSMTPSMLLLTI